MITVLRRSLRDIAASPPVAASASRLYEALDALSPRVAAGNARYRRGAPDGLPLPPADMRFLVAGTRDIGWFLEGGRRGAESLASAVDRAGLSAHDYRTILDFGCGCGRVLRHLRTWRPERLCGADYNHRLVDWCRQNLPFAEVSANRLAPPLPYGAGEFDLVYALSVFTHLTAELQVPWMAELAKITRPGGLIVLSVHGAAYVDRLNADERRAFSRGELVVKNNLGAPGANTCSAYHPAAYARDKIGAGLELVGFEPEGARGNPRQDLYLFRKPI